MGQTNVSYDSLQKKIDEQLAEIGAINLQAEKEEMAQKKQLHRRQSLLSRLWKAMRGG